MAATSSSADIPRSWLIVARAGSANLPALKVLSPRQEPRDVAPGDQGVRARGTGPVPGPQPRGAGLAHPVGPQAAGVDDEVHPQGGARRPPAGGDPPPP